jgi:adenosine deaminase CECR1
MRKSFDAALEAEDSSVYNEAHAQLLQQESDTVWDREAKCTENRSSESVRKEKKAAVIIEAIREYERRFAFGNLASEDVPGKETRDMGGQFLTNKDRIDHGSLLFQISRKVPKGGLLHLHFNAELHPERLLVYARSMKDLYIRSIRPLRTQDDLDETEMVFNVLDSDKLEKGVDIFSETYIGNSKNWREGQPGEWSVWMPWGQFQEDFEKHFPGKYLDPRKTSIPEGRACCEPSSSEPGSDEVLSPAENWLKSKMVLSEDEAYGLTQTVNG